MDTVKQDWREIDTSTREGLRALDIQIALRLGWKDFHEDEYWIEDWDAYDPAEDWFATPPNADDKRLLPRYTTDANAAFRLLETVKFLFNLEHDTNWYAVINPYTLNEDFIGMGTTPALAICKAWLAYTEKQPQP